MKPKYLHALLLATLIYSLYPLAYTLYCGRKADSEFLFRNAADADALHIYNLKVAFNFQTHKKRDLTRSYRAQNIIRRAQQCRQHHTRF